MSDDCTFVRGSEYERTSSVLIKTHLEGSVVDALRGRSQAAILSLVKLSDGRLGGATPSDVHPCGCSGTISLDGVRIMHPDREGPGVVADKIGAVVRDAQVVNYLPRTGVVYLAEGDTVTQQREQPIPGFEAPRRRPAFPFDIEGVFRGGADQFAMGETGCSGVVRISSPLGK